MSLLSRKTFFRSLAFLMLAILSACVHAGTDETAQKADEAINPDAGLNDPFLWLEEVEGGEALDWVRDQNARTKNELQGDPRYEVLFAEAKAIFNSDARIPYGDLHGQYVYNFWQDAEHVRGIWRRASVDSYKTDTPMWEIVLDIDALSDAENESWVFKGANCFLPDYERCIIRLSRGGKDASVYREFDTSAKSFVVDGFALLETKSQLAWLDADTLLVGTDFGDGALTTSGYPRTIKQWRRGTALSDAATVFEGSSTDVGVGLSANPRAEGSTPIITRSLTFFEAEYYVRRGAAYEKLPLPRKSYVAGVIDRRVLATLQDDWAYQGVVYPQGSLISLELGDDRAELIYAPADREAIQRVAVSKTFVFIQTLDNVVGKVKRLKRGSQGWSAEAVGFPKNGVITLGSFNPFRDDGLVRFNSPVTPDSLIYIDQASNLTVIRSMPALFDASGVVVQQLTATSKDGTGVPYFVVGKEAAIAAGGAPTYLYAYGGFSSSQLPRYSATVGKLWIERGGVFAIANIRGGGEFGPAWHQAAIKTNRQNAYDDFYAVAETLIQTGVTTPNQLGISGASNGGLLMGVALTQRPDLFNAVAPMAPLLDMIRYDKLLAGASWVAEYGDPDIEDEREYLLAYSPYHNINPDTEYPRPFFYTSTKDDRVHPGHARKMAARMESAGYPVLFFENTEGGHAGAANQNQRAVRDALLYTYFMQQLVDKNDLR